MASKSTKNTPVIVKGYKGFGKDFKCLNKRYEPNKTFKEPKAKLCSRGLHFCEYPLDCLSYYSPANGRYAEVEAENPEDKDYKADDSKRVTKHLSIGDEIPIRELANATIKYISTQPEEVKEGMFRENQEPFAILIEPRSASIINMSHGIAGAIGTFSVSKTKAISSIAATTSTCSIAYSSESRSAAITTASHSVAIAREEYSVAAATCSHSKVIADGCFSVAATACNSSALETTRRNSVIASTGAVSASCAKGDCSIACSSGDYNYLTVDGTLSIAASTGRRNSAEVKGIFSVAVAIGARSRAKGILGSCIVLAEYDKVGTFRKLRPAIIDGKKLKPDTWYTIKDRKIVEDE